MTWAIHQGDALELLRGMPDERFNCVVTSPPYWGLRDYGTGAWEGGDASCGHTVKLGGHGAASVKQVTSGGTQTYQARGACPRCGARRVDQQIGLEASPALYVARLVEVFREVRRVLRKDGTLWLNLGDCYITVPHGPKGANTIDPKNTEGRRLGSQVNRRLPQRTLKHKDLVGIPWMVARALQAPYYMGHIKREADRAWLAGFLDGEGTVSFVERDRGPDHTPTHDLRVFLTNCDDATLRQFAAVSGGHVYQHDGERENRFGSRPCFRWQMGTHDGALLLRELYPYLRTKRRQAALMWTLYTTLRHKNGHARTPEDVVAKRRTIAEMVRALNAGGGVDMPTWTEEPPPCFEPGWYLRSDIIWHKPNPMPESVTDRPTKAHEYLFLLSKSERYHYDAEAIAEEAKAGLVSIGARETRNKRSVWTITTSPYPEAHFATFPPALVEPCIRAGCPPGGRVLDPFAGAATTLLVATRLGRDSDGIELSPEYAAMARRRITQDAPLFNSASVER